ncbi:MAG: hypothetical protein ABI679_01830 [Gemmatimonadota bacterium]
MARLTAFARRFLPLLSLVLGVSTVSRAQQSSQVVQHWSLDNLRAGWCVSFLIDPAMANDDLPRGFRARAASTFPGLSPALSTLIRNEPNYATWIPSQFCAGHFDQVKIGETVLGDARPALNDTQYLGMWLIAGAPIAPAPDSATQTFFLATLRTSNWRLIRLAETALIPAEYAEPFAGKVPESIEDRYRVKMGGTSLTWDGHRAGDSAWTAPGIQQKWWAVNTRGARIMADVRMQPDSAQNVAGTLQFTGKDDLSKSLRASPIRMVGPLMWGGSGSIEFTR